MSGLGGGCQCGAVRFHVEGEPRWVSVCHCRMCQKATGGPFGVFASFPVGAVAWTRGERKTFRSSAAILRGFCGDCGTPLTFEALEGGARIGLTVGAFDDPSTLTVTRQLEREARLPWVDAISGLPLRSAADEAAHRAQYGQVVSRQHPDYDTETWSPSPSPATSHR